MNINDFTIHTVDWETHRDALYSVRHAVFVVEQQVPVEIEVDDLDSVCDHLLATTADGTPIGTARVDAEGHIGRVAVLKSKRKRGVGTALMLAAIECVKKNGLPTALLNSQTEAAGFYDALGFVSHGDEFMEAGIPHVAMRKELRK